METITAKDATIADLHTYCESRGMDNRKQLQLSQAHQTIQDKEKHVKVASSEAALSQELDKKVFTLQEQIQKMQDYHRRTRKGLEHQGAQDHITLLEEAEDYAAQIQSPWDLLAESEKQLATIDEHRAGLVSRAVI